MPNPAKATTHYDTALVWARADTLVVGDCPISLAGWRPAERVRVMPRAKRVIVWAGGTKYNNIPYDKLILTRRAA